MICLQTVKRFCKEYWKIENYQDAVNDKNKTWHCHHRLEEYLWCSAAYLIRVGRYYDVPAEELIFLTHKAHMRLHRKLNANVKWLENNSEQI